MSTSLVPPAGNRSAKQLQALAAGVPTTFRSERPALVSAIRLTHTATLAAATLRLETDGQTWASSQLIRVPLLCSKVGNDINTTAHQFTYVIEFRVPIVWTQEMPITITCSVACECYIDGDVVAQS
jgi:hypothetical protein